MARATPYEALYNVYAGLYVPLVMECGFEYSGAKLWVEKRRIDLVASALANTF